MSAQFGFLDVSDGNVLGQLGPAIKVCSNSEAGAESVAVADGSGSDCLLAWFPAQARLEAVFCGCLDFLVRISSYYTQQ